MWSPRERLSDTFYISQNTVAVLEHTLLMLKECKKRKENRVTFSFTYLVAYTKPSSPWVHSVTVTCLDPYPSLVLQKSLLQKSTA